MGLLVKRKRRPVVFVFRCAVADGIQRVAIALEPPHHQESLRDGEGRYVDQRPVPESWSTEASENV